MMDVIPVLDRLKIVAGIRTGYGSDTELANKLGVSSQVLNNWKKRNRVDWDIVITFLEKNECNLQYVITGNDPNIEIQQLKEMVDELEKKLLYVENLLLKNNI